MKIDLTLIHEGLLVIKVPATPGEDFNQFLG